MKKILKISKSKNCINWKNNIGVKNKRMVIYIYLYIIVNKFIHIYIYIKNKI